MNTQLQKEVMLDLPEGFTTRCATLDDVEPALALFNRGPHFRITGQLSVRGEDQADIFRGIEVWRHPFGADGLGIADLIPSNHRA